jgi:hypothetical protein
MALATIAFCPRTHFRLDSIAFAICVIVFEPANTARSTHFFCSTFMVFTACCVEEVAVDFKKLFA